ncbi:YihY family inner membrane protein [Novosphingobium sp. FSY-8]|uniref:YihY family inner membrane protein n=1 Tax=Novosphingobium ovatum TaxID=1908523 RepID=A0ABW9XH87_9SPHN|nr:YihY/virulence factor BrkB family protein [Novosphingobium ovatum]NBC37929.1 YihY family inner membrane protein [Novosphingobium ovatum]
MVWPNSLSARRARQVAQGVWRDGFIHAGNLAYMAILSLFPFFIVVGAMLSALGEEQSRAASVHAFLAGLPRVVANVLEPVGQSVIEARHGALLWLGCAIGLWTCSSLIETIRDILRRAYRVAPAQQVFWRHRLISGAFIMLGVMLLLVALYLQVALATVQELITDRFRTLHEGLAFGLSLSRVVPFIVLFGALYLLFFLLTPRAYRGKGHPTWPGALLVAAWWALVSTVLPVALRVLFTYDLTYGSLAGVMIALFFFWLVGLGMVTGAELNAALAISPATGQSEREPDVSVNDATLFRES